MNQSQPSHNTKKSQKISGIKIVFLYNLLVGHDITREWTQRLKCFHLNLPLSLKKLVQSYCHSHTC